MWFYGAIVADAKWAWRVSWEYGQIWSIIFWSRTGSVAD